MKLLSFVHLVSSSVRLCESDIQDLCSGLYSKIVHQQETWLGGGDRKNVIDGFALNLWTSLVDAGWVRTTGAALAVDNAASEQLTTQNGRQ